MPSKKPRIQSILEEEIHEKFKCICEKEMRSESQMASIIITKYVEEYENKNGTITTKSVNIGDNNNNIKINQ